MLSSEFDQNYPINHHKIHPNSKKKSYFEENRLLKEWFTIEYSLSPRTDVNYRVVENYDEHLEKPTVDIKESISPCDSVLLIRLSAIGDAVRVLPVVSFLRSNGFTGKLGFAVQSPIDQLLNLWDGIDRVHDLDRDHLPFHPIQYIQSVRKLVKEEYEWVFDLHGLIKSGLVTMFSGGRRRVGWHSQNSKEMNHFFQQCTVSPMAEGLPRILKYVQLVRSCTSGYQFTRENLTDLDLTFTEISREVQRLARNHPILVHPATSHSRYGNQKEWGGEKFRSLLARLRTESVRPIRLTWGPGEYDQAQDIARDFGERVTPTCETNLRELAYLIQEAQLLISGDTGPCHLADVLGTPLVALFGGSDYQISGPLLTNYRLITAREDEHQTKDIPVNRVYNAVLDLM